MDILATINKTWTLFLDRDGVINHEKKENYILNKDEFRFYDGVPEALKTLSEIFGTIVMVTNQRGIGKGLMTEQDLADIHELMLAAVVKNNGRIDKIYYCTSLDNDCFERKPNPGMAHKAKTDYPQIDFTRSLIIGNKLSDMAFGRNAGMYTIYVATTNPEVEYPHPLIDYRFNNLPEVASYLGTLTKS